MFINQQVDSETLPRAQSIRMQAMAPPYVREVMSQWALFAVPLLVAGVITWLLPLSPLPLKLALRTGASVIGLFMIGLGFLLYHQAKARGWALREHDVAYRSGLVWRKTIILPFTRVQHAEVTSGPLQRRFGLATLKFYTAGGSSVDLKITGLEAPQARALRDHILKNSDSRGSE
ncbi:MAG: PH domain-containing protein [Xanthomonadales bacterium]|nr:PH domain-containing protein [Xanthomonadales bacterium]